MKQMTLQQIAQACGGKMVCPQGQIVPDTEAACVVIDSHQGGTGGWSQLYPTGI